MNLDAQILLWIQNHLRVPALNPVMVGITLLGTGGVVWITILLLLLIRRRTRRYGLMGVVSLATGSLIYLILNRIVRRTRPFIAVKGLAMLGTKPLNYSFPSGHTTSAFAVAVIVFLCLPRKYGIPALILAALISFSRLYIGVHYPTDVLAGFLIGTLTAVVVHAFMLRLFRQRDLRRQQTGPKTGMEQ